MTARVDWKGWAEARIALGCLARDRAGSLAISAALIIPVAVALVFGTIDYSRTASAKSLLQDKLDAAALVAARSTGTTDAEVQSVGAAALNASLSGFKNGTVKNISFTLANSGRTVVASAEVEVAAAILGIFSDNSLSVTTRAEVVRQSSNVEVALVLDVTASMAGTKVADLKVAASDLIDLVVQDTQTPFYSKVAIVPYSQAVNVGSYAAQVRGAVSSTGTCTSPGCQYYRFYNPWWDTNTHQISTCVTERTGTYAYTDDPPTTALFGRNYPSTDNPCLASTIVPLSSDKTALKNAISGLAAGGSSGGQIGIGWGWFMVSPKFSYLWPTASKPAAYGTENLIKAVVIMTDGEYNSAYCNGVIAQDSASGSGSNYDKINCNATNGDSYSQSQKLCTNMKAQGVIVYTVGFNVWNSTAAQDLVNKCATSSGHVYLPTTGTALKDAFKSIAQDISKLRVSK